jgi:glucokinase
MTTQSMAETAGSYPRLVGDVGGTHARFATVESAGAGLSDISVHDCKDFAGIEELLRHRLAAPARRPPLACALGIATPVTGDIIRMTNIDWAFSIAELRSRLGLARLVVINDYAALAFALPTLAADELTALGGGPADEDANRAVLGPGTGLGVAGLTRCGPVWTPVVGEGGHVSLAAEDELEAQVLHILRDRFGHVSAERVLSGPGLVNLYQALCQVAGIRSEPIEPAELSRRALAGEDPYCRLAVDRFLGWLGAVAGDVALTLGARGGVYIAGGIAPQLEAVFAGSAFRQRFESKGRYRSYLAAVPTWLIGATAEVALRGANRALDVES